MIIIIIIIIIIVLSLFSEGNTFSEKKLIFHEALYNLPPKINTSTNTKMIYMYTEYYKHHGTLSNLHTHKHRLNSCLENEGSFPVMNIFLFYL